MKNLIPIESIQERDIDLLLLEELYSSKKFRKWFLDNTVGNKYSWGKFEGVWHSLSDSELGESDLVIRFSGKDNKGHLFLIEDKIDASFQPEQPLRYKQRGERYIKDKECNNFSTVLVAPKKYIKDNADFDFVIEYEQIKDWFLKQKDLKERAKYKIEVLNTAIEKSRRGYRPIPDERASGFWRSYWTLANQIAPELGMKEPRNDIPAGSSFIVFRPRLLPKDMKLYHKVVHGFVDLEFTGKGGQIDVLEKKYKALLNHGMTIEKTNKSAVIRLTTERLNLQEDIDQQKEFVVRAIKRAKELTKWAESNIINRINV